MLRLKYFLEIEAEVGGIHTRHKSFLSEKIIPDHSVFGDLSMNFANTPIYRWYRNALRNTQYRWWIILGTVVYLVSPFDLAPDLFPIVGQIDDLALLTLLVAEVSQILIDYFKARRAAPEPVEPISGQTNNTVDVDAVSVQE